MSEHFVTFIMVCPQGPDRMETRNLPVGVVFNKGDRVILGATAYRVHGVSHKVDANMPYSLCVALVPD